VASSAPRLDAARMVATRSRVCLRTMCPGRFGEPASFWFGSGSSSGAASVSNAKCGLPAYSRAAASYTPCPAPCTLCTNTSTRPYLGRRV
jgi:hypothetical protein